MRPSIGATIIAILFLAAAVYFWIGAATLLVAPGIVPPFTQRTLRHALTLTGPYPSLLVGVGYAIVGWGLFRLKNCARWAAILLMTVGGAFMLPGLMLAAIAFRWSTIWLGLQIVLRAVGVFHLLGDETRDIFVRQG